MNYTHTVTGDFIDNILIQLDDRNAVTYTRNEVMLGVYEGLRILDCLAFLNRELKAFELPTESSFIDLTSISDVEANLLVPYAKLVSELKSELDRHLLEDATSTATINKEVFDTDLYDKLIERKVVEFLLETGLIVQRELVPLTVPPVSFLQLGEDIVNIRRLAAKIDDSYHRLEREAEDNINSFFSYGSIDKSTPRYYSLTASPKNLLRFYPRIDAIGEIELISIKKPDFDDLEVLPVVSNLSWGIKYGILYEYFRQHGNGFDEQRAEYCKSRWQQAVNIGKNYPLILNMRFADLPASLDTLDSFDTFAPNWQNNVIDKYENVSTLAVAIVSWNMIALSAKLDASISAIVEIDFLKNTILPTTEDDYLQIPFEFVQILDAYVKHYLQIKIGGPRLLASVEKLNAMFEAVAKENARLNIPSNEIALVPYKTRIKQAIQKPIEAEGYELQSQTS